MSETQSVCKWCSQAIHLSTTVDIPELIWISPDGAVFCPKFAKPTSHEPVAEPASTGAPRESLSVQKRKHYMKGGHAADFVPAARPSGPSANFMQKIGGTCLKHGEYNGQQCPKWPDCIPAAAPEINEAAYESAIKNTGVKEFVSEAVNCPLSEEVKWTMKGLTAQGNAAPQTSTEPCPICGSTKSPHAVGLSCHIPTPIREINEFPAAPQPAPRADGPEHPIVGPEDGFPCCEHCAKHPGSQWTLKVSQPVSGDALPYTQDLPYLLQAADDVLAEQSRLNQKFTDKQNDLFTALMPWRDVNGKFEAAQISGAAPTRNSEVLASFVRYCQENPEHRFWQALRNWSGYHFVFVADCSPATFTDESRKDTFNWEGRRHDDRK